MLKDDCLFCKIIKGEIPANKIYEDEKVLVFKDIHPVAPIHVLAIPKTHIKDTNEINETNIEYITEIYKKLPEIAKNAGVFDDGYRIICNCGENGGQEVKHIHFHILGGKKLGPKL